MRGTLAGLLLACRGWTRLGFVRLADHVRERFGMAARTLEEEAAVVRALENLPATTLAFLEGNLSWTKTRLLASVARRDDEHEWLETASKSDTSALESVVRARLRCGETLSFDPDDDETSRVAFTVRVTRQGRRRWRAACELAERCEGSRLSQARILELVAAEVAGTIEWHHVAQGDGAAPPSGEAGRCADSEPPSGDAGQHADTGSPWGDAGRDSDNAPLAGDASRYPDAGPLSGGAWRNSDSGPGTMERDPEQAALLAECEAEEEQARRQGKTWLELDQERRRAHDEQVRDRLAKILRETELETDTAGLLTPLPTADPTQWFEVALRRMELEQPASLDCRLRAVSRALQGLDAELASLLREALEWKRHRVLGLASFECYVRDHLGLCVRRAWSLIAIDRASSNNCRELREAWRDGRLSYLAARTLLPVLGPRYARAWIERAATVTLRRLEAEVAWALDRRDEIAAGPDGKFPDSDAKDAGVDGGTVSCGANDAGVAAGAAGCGANDAAVGNAVGFRSGASTSGTDAAFTEVAPPPEDFDLAAATRALLASCDGRLQVRAADTEGPAEVAFDTPGPGSDALQFRAHGAQGTAGPDGAECQPDAGATTGPAPENTALQLRADRLYVNLRFEIAPETASLVGDILDALRSGSEPRGLAFERMVDLAILEWSSLPRHRDPVFERDGWRCAVPACGSRRNLHDHHILFRSHGGTNARDNRVTVCAAHHLHHLHTGRIRAHGPAPHGVVWNTPFGRLVGDRYAARA